jgi:asparagine synthase (glutamine-hydrolysing)
MCGIAGFTHVGRAPAPGRIQAITEALHHRGPDQQGVWESQAVSLGAVRLKIIDLEHGTQPMSAPAVEPARVEPASGRLATVIVYNGEVYNHDDLRRELEALGHKFESRCDTEVVLHAFLEWDLEAFTRLRGMYAAALWTETERRLVLVRDRMGIKPLYFSRQDNDLYFGSELKTILAHPHIARRLDPAALDRYLSLNYSPGPHTLVEGIEKLPPGHWLEWRDGQVTTGAYWRAHFQVDRTLDLNSAKQELDRLLRDSVREHLVADVPLGVWSSGGLDSTSILHYAAESAAGRLKTFSVSFRGREFDESNYFREVAQRYQTDHHEFDLNPEQDLPAAIEQLATYADEPSADAGALPVWFLSQMCRREVTVALSGEGADELFAGYNTYRADGYARALRHVPLPLRRLAARLAHGIPVSDRKIGLDYKLTRMLDGSLLDPLEAHFFWNGTFTRDQVRALRGSPDGAWADLPAPDESAGPLNRFLELDQMYYLPDDILNKCDRMSMAHSLEVRPPFLDHRIVEFAATLPEHLKIKGGTLKFLLRELMQGRLPPAVLKRPKEGFDIPTHDWLRTILRPLLLDTLSERNVRDSGFLRWEMVHQTIETHLQRRANMGYHLWGLLILFLWMKRWNIQPPCH